MTLKRKEGEKCPVQVLLSFPVILYMGVICHI